MTVNARKRRPSNNASATNSTLQISFIALTSCFGCRRRADLFRRDRQRRSERPSAR
jgi:hypothetical protein